MFAPPKKLSSIEVSGYVTIIQQGCVIIVDTRIDVKNVLGDGILMGDPVFRGQKGCIQNLLTPYTTNNGPVLRPNGWLSNDGSVQAIELNGAQGGEGTSVGSIVITNQNITPLCVDISFSYIGIRTPGEIIWIDNNKIRIDIQNEQVITNPK